MLGLPELDGDVEGRDRKHAAPLHPRSGRGPRHLKPQQRRRRPGSAPLALAIDAAGSSCAAAVGRGEELVASANVPMLHGQAEALLLMVDAVMHKAGFAPSDLNLIAVTTGPGSFTGIRVGIAAARGIALALGLPLIGISSFEAVAAAVPDSALAEHGLLVALDSRRADLYVQLFASDGLALSQPFASLPERLAQALPQYRQQAVAVAGDAAARAAQALAQGFEVSVIEAPPNVAGALRVALRRWRRGEWRGVVRPLYLRPPDVGIPGKLRPPIAP